MSEKQKRCFQLNQNISPVSTKVVDMLVKFDLCNADRMATLLGKSQSSKKVKVGKDQEKAQSAKRIVAQV